MTENNQDLASIFLAAVEIRDPLEREQMLNRACASAELKRQVEILLDAQSKAKDFLSTPPQDMTLTAIHSDQVNSIERNGQPSVLTRLKEEFDLDQVFLKSDGPNDVEPILKPHSSELPSRRPDEKYQIQGEIARGGMGAVLKGRDVDLGRSLAIKVLLESHKDQPDVIQRFIEEAQIGGQLQHPGIAPVYELGQFDDQRPFFTMKLVKGKTLAALLADRSDFQDRGKLLGIFEQICQTMAYAHSRGVIHRDLKPSNVMVGAFGEVQVMDWGVAKVLEEGGIADEKRVQDQLTDLSIIQTARSEGSGPHSIGTDQGTGSQTIAGSVMGTPAYMPPEQASGEVDRLDERCDVFGLGAILCQILTGRPPYLDDNTKQVLYLAQQAKLEAAFEKLDQCGADPMLIDLAKECLAPEMSDRPRNAEIMAKRVAEYLESVESRLHETELARVAEATRVVEERKRRKIAIALAASILLTFLLGSVSWIWNQQQVRQRQMVARDKVNSAMTDARLHTELADSSDLTNKVSELDMALASATTASELAKDKVVDDSLRDSADQLVSKIKSQLEVTNNLLAVEQRTRTLKKDLESIRLEHADGKKILDATSTDDNFNKAATSKRYQEVFLAANLDMKRPTNGLAADIAKSPIRETIISALDHWIRNLPTPTLKDKFFASMGAGSWEAASKEGLKRIDEAPGTAIRWLNVAPAIAATGDKQAYADFCQRAVIAFANNESIFERERIIKACLILPDAIPLDQLKEKALFKALDEDSVPSNARYWRFWAWTCRALWNYRKGNFQEAIDCVNESQLNPLIRDDCRTLNLCILALSEAGLGQKESADIRLQSAGEMIQHCLSTFDQMDHDIVIAWLLYREAEKKIHGKNTDGAFALDSFFKEENRLASESIQVIEDQKLLPKLWSLTNAVDESRWRRAVRRAIRSRNATILKKLASGLEAQGQSAELLVWLAAALRESRQTELAVSLLERVQRENPGDFWVNYELGRGLLEVDREREGLGFCRAALAIRPNSHGAKWAVVAALIDCGRRPEAEAQFDQLLQNADLSESACYNLAYSLENREIYNLAERAYRKTIELNPDRARYVSKRAEVLFKLGRKDEALTCFQQAIALQPEDGYPHYKLGYHYAQIAEYQLALSHLKKAVELNPHDYNIQHRLGLVLVELDDLQNGLEHIKRATELLPMNRSLRGSLIEVLRKMGRFPEAFAEQKKLDRSNNTLEKSLRARLDRNPQSANLNYLVGRVLYEQKKHQEAEKFLSEAVRLDKSNSLYQQILGIVLKINGKLTQSLTHCQKAVDLDPTSPYYYYSLARSLEALGRVEEAIESLKQGIKVKPSYKPQYRYLAKLQSEFGNAEEALKTALTAVEQSPNNVQLLLQLSEQYMTNGNETEAKKQLDKAMQLSRDRGTLEAYYLAAISLNRQGQFAKAREIYKQGLDVKETPQLHMGIAATYGMDGFPEKALEAIETAMRVGASTTSTGGRTNFLNVVHFPKSNCLMALGRYEEALEELEVAQQKNPNPDLKLRISCRICVTNCLLGNYKEAFEGIRNLADQHPDSPVVYNVWAWMHVMSPDPSGNFVDATRAIELAKKSVELKAMRNNTNTLGIAYYRGENYEAAIQTLNRSIDLGYDSFENWIFLALANAKSGKHDEARKWYQKCLDWKKSRTLYGETKSHFAEAEKLFADLKQ